MSSFKVELASNVFPKFTVYDSNAKPGFISKLIDVGVTVDAEGVSIYQSPNNPRFNPLIQYGVFGIMFVSVLFAVYKIIPGVKS